MADEKTEVSENFRIDTDAISLVDRTHPGSDKCPVCDNATWYVMQQPDRVIPIIPMSGHTQAFVPQNGIELIALACQRCGYLRSYVLPIFMEYVKELRDGHESE